MAKFKLKLEKKTKGKYRGNKTETGIYQSIR